MRNDIRITELEEHEDGSATIQLDLSPEVFAEIFQAGFIALVKRGLKEDD
jgi:hypothetical protein